LPWRRLRQYRAGVKRSDGYKAASDGAMLFTRRWIPDPPLRGAVCLVHGFGEHAGRYEPVGARLAAAGYAVNAFDLRGHGRSAGRRGDTRFAATMGDLDAMLGEARAAAGPDLPVFLYGHSLGGLIVLHYLLDRRPAISGAVVSAPVLHTAVAEQRLKVWLSMTLGRVLPWLSIPAGLDDSGLTRDADVLAAYRADPLVHHKASLGFARDVLLAADRVLAGAASIGVPLYLVHGKKDPVNYVTGSEAVAACLGDRCTLVVHDEALHEPHHDPDAPAILDAVVAWLDARAATGTAQSSA
jgi:acylglycerol lipase